MKKLVLVGAFVFLSVTPVFAIEPTMAAKRAETRAEFRESVQKIKDERKKMIVQNVYNKMCEVQKKRVSVMTNNLNKMTLVLSRVSTKSATLADDKKATVTAAVNTAKTSVADAMVAVKTLEEKKCEFSLTGSDAIIKTEVSTARMNFERDIKATAAKVELARKSVMAAVRALANASGEKI